MERIEAEVDGRVGGGSGQRVVVLIDMDCFYCQVEEAEQPALRGKPLAVVQYNPWKGGGIIAVNYAARERGVTRHMRGDDARAKCPEIQLCVVPCVRGKADISKYREAGKRVARVLQQFTPLLERASIDEAYLDVTAPALERLRSAEGEWSEASGCADTFALGYSSWEELVGEVRAGGAAQHTRLLVAAALLVRDVRAAVLRHTGYECSAGIAHNKMLAKVVCGMNKPNKQTVLPKESLGVLYEELPLRSVRQLGGKFGEVVCRTLGVRTVAQLQRFTRDRLRRTFDDKNGSWLYNIARGIDDEPVQAKFNSKSIGCCKQFRGAAALRDTGALHRWLRDLATEIQERLDRDTLDNNRRPRHMVVSFRCGAPAGDVSSSRSHNLSAEDALDAELLYCHARRLIGESVAPACSGEENCKLPMPIKFLGISVGKFEENTESKKVKTIVDFFSSAQHKQTNHNPTSDICTDETLLKLNANIKKSIKRVEGKEPIFQKYFQSTNNASVDLYGDDDCFDENKTVCDSTSLGIDPNLPTTSRPHRHGATAEEAEDSGSDHSGSTIDVQREIDRSLSLSGPDRDECERVQRHRASLLSTPRPEEEAVCPECGDRMAADSLATHLDFHLALRLREQERTESRSNAERGGGRGHRSIASFFPRVAAAAERCAECGSRVVASALPEHLDFHHAQRLSRQINGKALPAPAAPASRPIKRKHPHRPVSIKQTKKLCVSLDNFLR